MKIISFLCFWCLCLLSAPAISKSNAQSADALYKKYSESIFQVRIVDIRSGNQFSIGTGFIIGDGSLLATNYHVISSLVDKPEQYRVEVLLTDKYHQLELVVLDVIHDLAILRSKEGIALGEAIPFAKEAQRKGQVLYSIGNPHDIGMTVIAGTYNGLAEHRFIDIIHFSGAINPGMSGGPVINPEGEVIGVNVAKSGDQIGFLVPVDKLQMLLAKSMQKVTSDFFQDIAEQISQFNSAVIKKIVRSDWPKESMGEAKVIGQILPQMQCWGDSHHDDKTGLSSISKGCKSQENFYINSDFGVGRIEYEFIHYTAEHWNSITLYNYVSQVTANARPGNRAGKDSVHNYQCHAEIIDNGKKSFKRKVNYCVRAYKKFKNLYDVFYLGNSIGKSHNIIMEHYTLSGVNKASALLFLERFLESVQWQ